MSTCNNCGWVHFDVTREYAVNQVKEFNEWYRTQSDETKKCYGNHESSLHQYEHCMVCGGSYKNFRESKKEDCPIGCTLNPIIRRED